MTVIVDGEWLHSPAELGHRGWAVTPIDDIAGVVDPDGCLCGVDVHAVLARHGVAYTDDGSGFLVVAGTHHQEGL